MADAISRLVQRLSRLPGVGEKSALRLAFHIVRGPASQARELAEALVDAVDNIRLCASCMNFTEDDTCAICRDERRDREVICVVTSPAEVAAIDSAGEFRGGYHVLHGVLSPLEGVGPDDIHVGELVARIQRACGSERPVAEVIVATAASVEGEATAMYLAKQIKPMGVKVTRIATGIPVGGDLEYSDRATISRALSGRAPI